MKKIDLKKKDILQIAIFATYFMFNLILLIRHEMWRDEINVWLMGRDLSVIELFREIKYQGHPCLWYLLIMPFAKLGFPCRVMGIISLGIMSTAAWFFLYKAPVALWAKAIVLFSPIFTYYYTEIARGYCLVAFFIIVLAYYHNVRNEKPIFYGILLALLVQADTIAVPVAGMISAMWLFENGYASIKNKSKDSILIAARGLWLPLASLGLFVLQFYRVSDSPVFEVKDMGLYDTITAIIGYLYYIPNRLTGLERTGCNLLFLFLAVIGIGMGFVKKTIWPMLVFVATVLFQCVFSCMVYQLNIFHFISLCFVYLWMIWVYGDKEIRAKKTEDEAVAKLKMADFGMRILAGAWIAAVAVFMFVQWNSPQEVSSLGNALHGSYSDGVHTAEYIENNLSGEELIVTTDVAFASTIFGFAKEHRAYYAGSGKETSYADWSEEQTGTITYENMLQWIREEFPEKDSFILIECGMSCIEDFDREAGEVLYKTQTASAKQEDYTIYRINLE